MECLSTKVGMSKLGSGKMGSKMGQENYSTKMARNTLGNSKMECDMAVAL